MIGSVNTTTNPEQSKQATRQDKKERNKKTEHKTVTSPAPKLAPMLISMKHRTSEISKSKQQGNNVPEQRCKASNLVPIIRKGREQKATRRFCSALATTTRHA